MTITDQHELKCRIASDLLQPFLSMLIGWFVCQKLAKLERLEYLECIKLGIEAGRLSSIETKLDNDDIEWTIETFEQYCEYNKYDRRETVAIETPFSKTLYEDDSLHIIYEGKIDHVIKI